MKTKLSSSLYGTHYESDNGDTSDTMWVSSKPIYGTQDGMNLRYYVDSKQIVEVHNEYFSLSPEKKLEILQWMKSFIREQKKLLKTNPSK